MQKIGPGFLIAERYQFVELIGEGGMGKVYLADDLLLSRRVAVKTVHPEMSNTPEVAKRIDQECRLHARLGVQPNIVALHDRLVQDEQNFLILEYVEGETLESLLQMCNEKTPVLSVEQGGDIVNQVLVGLHCIHTHGMVHNDVKPSNILLQKLADRKYLAKLMDFGIAALPGIGSAGDFQQRDPSEGNSGTPTYMAPECIDHNTFGEVGASSDLYAAGIILYQLLAGQPPFTGSMNEILAGHVNQLPDFKPLESKVGPQCLEVLEKVLQKKQEQRYQTASSFSSALTSAYPLCKASGEIFIQQVNETSTEKTLSITQVPKSVTKSVTPVLVTGTGLHATLLTDRKKMAIIAGVLVLLLMSGASWFLGKVPLTSGSATPPGKNVDPISSTAPQSGESNGTAVDYATEYRLSPPVTAAEPPQESGEESGHRMNDTESENSLKVFQAARQEKLNQLVAMEHVAENAERGPSITMGKSMGSHPVIGPEERPTGSDWKVIKKYSRKIGP